MQQDTRQLLRTGIWIFGTGALSAALMLWAFGGVTRQGPHTNSGWLALIIAMGCLPMGTLVLSLGLIKLLGELVRRRR
ncbi:MAG TPA: hypothetical protein VGC07_02000 [Granulicella sp.]